MSSNPSTVTFPTSGANTDSKKYVKGALDSDFSRFPLVGNTNLNGDGEYEIYIENTGFDPIQQLDVADVLPYIGDMSLTATGSRGSQWSEELANAITIERYTIGSGWSTVPAGQLPLGVMYANTYNACYLDGALPAGQITADPAIASEGQAAGCTDMSTANPAAGAKGFAFRWLNTTTPLTFGEQLRVKINVRQLTGEADYTNGEIAWNSLAYTATAVSTGALLSSEPIKVGLKMIDPATTAAIGDYVWLDGNANGRQDAGETPVEGVRVSLYDAAGQPVIIPNSGGQQAVTTTNANGYYCFPGLTPNTTYYVRLDHAADYNSGAPLSGYTLTTANAVADDVDSDAAMGTLAGAATPRPQITSPTLGPGTQTKTYDFGFVCLGSVSGYVWMDTDLSGSQDPGEMAQSGVTVTLRDAVTNAAVGAAQMTNAGGLYSFTSVPAGVYYVEFSGFPGGKIPTFKDLTGNDADDSDANPNGQTDIFPVSSCGSADMDLGLRLPPVNPATICGTAWDDLNKDGAFQVTEPGMPSVTVQLLDVNGFTLNSVTTDVNGNYCFTNLDPNVSYKVAFVPPAVNIMFSVAGPDQDVDLMTGVTTATYTPTNNQTINDVDAGFMGPLSIGNQVWSDANNNGLFDNGEAIFSGLEVRLIASDGTTVLATTTTDGNGRYVFKNLNAGTYYVEVESPAGFLSSADIATTNTPNSTDSDDNGAGTAMSGYIRSTAVTLANDGGIPGSANWTEADHGLPINGMIDPASNAKAYYTVDFGFYPLPLCVQPTDVTFTQMAPGCLGAMPLNNGTISLATVTDGTNYGVSTLNAGTYDGPVYPATAIPGTLPAVIQSMVPNTGGTYIVRVFNGAADCYTDVPVVVAPVTCNCPTIPCGTTTVIKN
ncbi:MAG: SdrD B-like domain-containing protein [Saprospiraceae bacterium]